MLDGSQHVPCEPILALPRAEDALKIFALTSLWMRAELVEIDERESRRLLCHILGHS